MLSDEYLFRFSGLERLYSRDELVRLAKSNVLIIGLGGVGSWTAEALARSGVGQLTLFDFDDICISNTNRQVHTNVSTVGKQKTQVMQERLLQINPELNVSLIEKRLHESEVKDIVNHSWDLVIDAIDGYREKCALVKHCWENRIPLITTGGSGGKVDPTQIQTADLNKSFGDPLLHQTRKSLRIEFGMPRGRKEWGIPCVFSPEDRRLPGDECPVGPLDCRTGFGTASYLTGSFGLITAWKAVELLLGKDSKTNARY